MTSCMNEGDNLTCVRNLWLSHSDPPCFLTHKSIEQDLVTDLSVIDPLDVRLSGFLFVRTLHATGGHRH